MASVRQPGKEDIRFVAGETSEVYHHTAGLVILDTRDCPEFSFDYLKEKVIQRIRDVPHFRWRISVMRTISNVSPCLRRVTAQRWQR